MKKGLLLFVCMFAVIFTGCDDTGFDNVEILVLADHSSQASLDIYRLYVNKDRMNISESPLCTISAQDYELETVKYWDSDKLIMAPETLSFNAISEESIITANVDSLFYQDYRLDNADDYKWKLSNNRDGSEIEISFTYQDNKYHPICFYINDTGDKAYFLCNYLYIASEFSVAVFVLDFSADKIQVNSCDDGMIENKISPVQYPFDFTSVSVTPNGFLYNEGTRIFSIDGETGKMTLSFDESSVMKNVPLADSHRETYYFFTFVSHQNNYYLLTFPAYNELRGCYVAIYNLEKKYCGSILITELKITMYDAKNMIVDEIYGNWKVNVYV